MMKTWMLRSEGLRVCLKRPFGNTELGSSVNPQARMPALRRSAGIRARGFWRHPSRQFRLFKPAARFVSGFLIFLAATVPSLAGKLEQSFAHPPASARPWVYWFWLNGNITSNGITADLEAMKRVGIGGVLIMEVDQGTPKGDAAFGGPRWRQLFKHVCTEAHRLGLEVNMNNDAGWCGSGGPWITPDLAMQKVVATETNLTGPLRFEAALAKPDAVAGYYRDIVVLAFLTPEGAARIERLPGKAAFVPSQVPPGGNWPAVPAEQTVPRERIVNLTAQMDTAGRLTWNVPTGNWTILRLGHTLTGKDNHPAPEAGRGLESDKLSRTATDAMFAGLMGKLVAQPSGLRPSRQPFRLQSGPPGRMPGDTIASREAPATSGLVATHIDSWETGSQNWTPKFREEFQRLRGYDPLLLLPVMTGRVVESVEVSERFLWDVRRTVSDLLITNYAGRFRELAHQNGLRLSIEAYDGNPCDDMTYAGQADEPMAEFWSWGAFGIAYSCTEMASAAHVYGRRILGAEAFTATDGEKWLHHPASIKALGDWAFCEGINRFVFHRYALQPWTNPDRAPGMAMGPWGLHYERTQTWWEQSAAWHEYLARCQFLLREGLFVADICFLEPEGSPMRFTPTLPGGGSMLPERPRYNFDGCTPEVLLTRMKVKDGKLVLPDGMSYRLLVLPQIETMTPALLRKIKELVQAGATVLGPPPQKSPGLANYPQCDAEVEEVARELWSKSSGVEHRVGKGRVIWNEAFRTPPIEIGESSPVKNAKWIWHAEGNPAIAAPPGKRFFRRFVVLDAAREVAAARIAMTADNGFELWVNGQRAGAGEDANQLFRMDVSHWLKPGTNLLAVAGFNAHSEPNPAALIGTLSVQFRDGTALEVNTDGQWQSAVAAPEQWREDAASSGWSAALEVGPLGLEPFPVPEQTRPPAYVFPDFGAITNVLGQMGVPPDFEGDSNLRYIHRRVGDVEIYFVSNRSTNWCGASCAFRVTGKAPELWNPLTGEIQRQLIYEERAERTVLPLWLEPAGSVFVVFRKSGGREPTRIMALERNGESLLPKVGEATAQSPPVEVLTGRGPDSFRAWQPGRYTLRHSAQNLTAIDVAPLPPPHQIGGPWDVRFEPNRGAPERVSFERLISWSEHSDAGVKYFSGHANYRTTFVAGEKPEGRNLHWFLDLGRVEVIAEVRLNGKDLGTLWRPPYRVEVTEAQKPGENTLEVKVVNLWVNRQIGDEQLPDDSERNPDGTLKSCPQWLREGKLSPTGRSSFTSWRLWKKDSPLQESGLLGPVRLIPAAQVAVSALPRRASGSR